MTKIIILAAALFAVPTAAAAAERTFTRDGVTYTYTSAKQGERTVITGKTSQGSAYTLTVRGKRVSGLVGGTPVAFTIAKPLAGSVKTASID
ncbi:hypothetical protein [Sphingomonas turrisvirgatae]|uniref:Uncharacterized protein n=1 Tax=Sphingomonas turrisvirgatae TaxID=1888892 RepID=A0A1E3LSA8_9SPHN|nr:hypothetical protein [Sphingomonas turrisvirgatae]ODP36629.1 hypothetical protein BFL28_04775 [Sphingomonas turrisvirgatae]